VIHFAEFAAGKTRAAIAATLFPLVTVEDHSTGRQLTPIGNAWTRGLYDGDFALSPVPDAAPAVSLVFVQSSDRNTVTDNPDDLGGGPTDKHLIYEGLSRVGADAVMAGAVTAGGDRVFFSVWHPELVALRAALGLPRHPVQIIVSGDGRFDVERSMTCNVPDVRAIVVTSANAASRFAGALARRPWLSLVLMTDGNLRGTLARIRQEYGIHRISVIGGRMTATTLVDAGLAQDLYLTTTARAGGQPDTPPYAGTTPPRLDRILEKRGTDPDHPIVFEHYELSPTQITGDQEIRR
jgi:riboflavin biosynthesis pyrimidine reductase